MKKLFACAAIFTIASVSIISHSNSQEVVGGSVVYTEPEVSDTWQIETPVSLSEDLVLFTQIESIRQSAVKLENTWNFGEGDKSIVITPEDPVTWFSTAKGPVACFSTFKNGIRIACFKDKEMDGSFDEVGYTFHEDDPALETLDQALRYSETQLKDEDDKFGVDVVKYKDRIIVTDISRRSITLESQRADAKDTEEEQDFGRLRDGRKKINIRDLPTTVEINGLTIEMSKDQDDQLTASVNGYYKPSMSLVAGEPGYSLRGGKITTTFGVIQ